MNSQTGSNIPLPLRSQSSRNIKTTKTSAKVPPKPKTVAAKKFVPKLASGGGGKPKVLVHADRRGISEIKRSEIELQKKVIGFQEQLDELENETQELNKDVQLREEEISGLQEEIQKLNTEKMSLANDKENLFSFMESKNLDPSTHQALNMHDIERSKTIHNFTTTMHSFCNDVNLSLDGINKNVEIE